jgi:beta-glucosidase
MERSSREIFLSISTDRPWRDPALPAAERAGLLLAAMTLEEKIAQLGSRWAGNDMADHELAERSPDETINVAPMEDVFSVGGSLSLEEASRDGLGHLTRVWGSYPQTVEEGVAEVVRQHEVVLNESRLGVPALVHEECLTGFTTYGATVYPASIAWGATRRWSSGWRRRSGATWRRSVCTKDCRRCSTSCVTIAGAASRRRWARTLTW